MVIKSDNENVYHYNNDKQHFSSSSVGRSVLNMSGFGSAKALPNVIKLRKKQLLFIFNQADKLMVIVAEMRFFNLLFLTICLQKSLS